MIFTILAAINALFNIISLLVLVDVFASWMPFLHSYGWASKILRMIHALTEPIMNPVRKLMAKTPLGNMPIDFSPVIVLILLSFIQRFLMVLLIMVL